MKRHKAIRLVETIIASHSDALRSDKTCDTARALEVLSNARSDLIALVEHIYAESDGNDTDGDDVKLVPADRRDQHDNTDN